MTRYTPKTGVGLTLAEYLQPALNDQLGWYLDAIGAMFEDIHLLANDVGSDDGFVVNVPGSGYVVEPYTPGYGSVLDPDLCPPGLLPFLGQFVGVRVPDGTPAGSARTLVKEEAGFARGSQGAIVNAATNLLSGTQYVAYSPRIRPDSVADAYWFLLTISKTECANPAALIAAVNFVKPGGLLWQLRAKEGFYWDTSTGTWISTPTITWNGVTTLYAQWADAIAANGTWNTLVAHPQ